MRGKELATDVRSKPISVYKFHKYTKKRIMSRCSNFDKNMTVISFLLCSAKQKLFFFVVHLIFNTNYQGIYQSSLLSIFNYRLYDHSAGYPFSYKCLPTIIFAAYPFVLLSVIFPPDKKKKSSPC